MAKRLVLTAACAWAAFATDVGAKSSKFASDDLSHCVVCHGTEGRGNAALQAPRIAGLSEWYVRRQLTGFRVGWRGAHPEDIWGMEMAAAARMLTDEDVTDKAVDYAVSFTAAPATPQLAGRRDVGRALYEPCAACHGPWGDGDQTLGSPRLAGQNDWYVVRQLTHFRDGVRGAHPNDATGAVMAEQAADLSDEAILDLAAYISSFEEPGDD